MTKTTKTWLIVGGVVAAAVIYFHSKKKEASITVGTSGIKASVTPSGTVSQTPANESAPLSTASGNK